MTKKINTIEQDLQQREKAELIAIIKLMLEQQPELAWILQTPLPVAGKRTQPINAGLYRNQIETAVSAAIEHHRDRTYREAMQHTLTALQTTADEFAGKNDYLAALTIYEVLVAAAIKHYFTVETGYLIFTPILTYCIDGLDSCIAEAGKNLEMRLRAFKALLAIYHFSVDSLLDLGEDIPDLLVGNTTSKERQILAGWVRDALARLTNKAGPGDEQSRTYRMLLRRLEK